MYPLASNVARSPPEGKLDASGSPFIRFLPENRSITPFFDGSIKASCFSAVTPVTRIGRIRAADDGERFLMYDKAGNPVALPAAGFDHFRSEAA